MRLKFDKDKCIGCKLCQLACSAANEEVFNPSLARLFVETYYAGLELKAEGRVCTLCGQCVEVCPVSAIKMEERKLVLYEEVCINCGICVDSCPEGVIVQKKNTVGICGLCEGDPWCVKSCPHGALCCTEVI
ncbi:MAG: 4Fe-4S binding protein [Bacillota bacterium]|nr:4Fe-4S binding protein [Bacillota bacterium]